MTKTRAKKKKLILRAKNIRNFKKDNNITKCSWCGYPIKNSCHHYLCWICWGIKQKTTKHNLKKAKELRIIQTNKKNIGHIKTVY